MSSNGNGTENSDKDRNGKGQFAKGNSFAIKPGCTRNPKGSKPGRKMADKLRRIVMENDGQIAQDLIDEAIRQAKKGHCQFWQLIIDRVDGPLKEQIEHQIDVVVTYEDVDVPQCIRDRAIVTGMSNGEGQ